MSQHPGPAPASSTPAPTPLRLVVMGVTSTGKSTVAEGVGAAFGLLCLDGDHLHSPQSVEKMSAGIPLTDEDRWPWLARIGVQLARIEAPGLVISCSALRRVYRDVIRQAAPDVRFLFLDGSPEVIRARMQRRTGHYMPVSLLDTQLALLERPGADERDVLRVDIDADMPAVIESAVAAVLADQPQARRLETA